MSEYEPEAEPDLDDDQAYRDDDIVDEDARLLNEEKGEDRRVGGKLGEAIEDLIPGDRDGDGH